MTKVGACRFALGCLCATLAVRSVAPARATDGATIRLRYVTVEDRIRPDPATSIFTERTIVAHLSSGGKVSEVYARGSGPNYREYGAEGRLGGSESRNVRWRVINTNTLVRTRELEQSVQTIIVRVKGSTCEMTFADRFKPGFKEVKNTRIRDGVAAFYSLAKVSESSCAIE